MKKASQGTQGTQGTRQIRLDPMEWRDAMKDLVTRLPQKKSKPKTKKKP